MKYKLIITALSSTLAIFATSCQNSDSKEDNPYGAPAAAPLQTPAANPYAAPQTGAYNPNGAPYQPLPGLPAQSPSVNPSKQNLKEVLGRLGFEQSQGDISYVEIFKQLSISAVVGNKTG